MSGARRTSKSADCRAIRAATPTAGASAATSRLPAAPSARRFRSGAISARTDAHRVALRHGSRGPPERPRRSPAAPASAAAGVEPRSERVKTMPPATEGSSTALLWIERKRSAPAARAAATRSSSATKSSLSRVRTTRKPSASSRSPKARAKASTTSFSRTPSRTRAGVDAAVAGVDRHGHRARAPGSGQRRRRALRPDAGRRTGSGREGLRPRPARAARRAAPAARRERSSALRSASGPGRSSTRRAQPARMRPTRGGARSPSRTRLAASKPPPVEPGEVGDEPRRLVEREDPERDRAVERQAPAQASAKPPEAHRRDRRHRPPTGAVSAARQRREGGYGQHEAEQAANNRDAPVSPSPCPGFASATAKNHLSFRPVHASK